MQESTVRYFTVHRDYPLLMKLDNTLLKLEHKTWNIYELVLLGRVNGGHSQKTRCWANVEDGGLALNQHLVNVSCLLDTVATLLVKQNYIIAITMIAVWWHG